MTTPHLLGQIDNGISETVAAGWLPLAVLAMTISIENITTGMGTTAFVAYMSSLCNVAYTATQYALLTSLMILLFLGSWRSTVIIAVSIPLAILGSIDIVLGETDR